MATRNRIVDKSILGLEKEYILLWGVGAFIIAVNCTALYRMKKGNVSLVVLEV